MTGKGANISNVRLDALTAGMTVQVPQGRRPWYRILRISEVGGEPRQAWVEQFGGKLAGSQCALSFYDYAGDYVVSGVSEGETE